MAEKSTGLSGILESKKMLFGGFYVIVSTALLIAGLLEGGQWVAATASVVAALVASQAYQDRAYSEFEQ